MAWNTGIATWLGVGGQTAKNTFKGIADEATFLSLLTTLEGVSDCQVKFTSFASQDMQTVLPPVTGNVDRKAVLTFQNIADGNVHKFELPGYNGATTYDNDGEIVESVQADTLVNAIASALGMTVVRLRCPVIQQL